MPKYMPYLPYIKGSSSRKLVVFKLVFMKHCFGSKTTIARNDSNIEVASQKKYSHNDFFCLQLDADGSNINKQAPFIAV